MAEWLNRDLPVAGDVYDDQEETELPQANEMWVVLFTRS